MPRQVGWKQSLKGKSELEVGQASNAVCLGSDVFSTALLHRLWCSQFTILGPSDPHMEADVEPARPTPERSVKEAKTFVPTSGSGIWTQGTRMPTFAPNSLTRHTDGLGVRLLGSGELRGLLVSVLAAQEKKWSVGAESTLTFPQVSRWWIYKSLESSVMRVGETWGLEV